jgi:hypothetical protein
MPEDFNEAQALPADLRISKPPQYALENCDKPKTSRNTEGVYFHKKNVTLCL